MILWAYENKLKELGDSDHLHIHLSLIQCKAFVTGMMLDSYLCSYLWPWHYSMNIYVCCHSATTNSRHLVVWFHQRHRVHSFIQASYIWQTEVNRLLCLVSHTFLFFSSWTAEGRMRLEKTYPSQSSDENALFILNILRLDGIYIQ